MEGNAIYPSFIDALFAHGWKEEEIVAAVENGTFEQVFDDSDEYEEMFVPDRDVVNQ